MVQNLVEIPVDIQTACGSPDCELQTVDPYFHVGFEYKWKLRMVNILKHFMEKLGGIVCGGN